MTCLELMKKLRPDLSEVEIHEFWCPSSHGVHMAKYPDNEPCQTGYYCKECWNREVDEEMVYFQDEAVEERKPETSINEQLRHNFLAACDNFDSAMELVYKKEREIAELKDEIEKLSNELNISRRATKSARNMTHDLAVVKNEIIDRQQNEIAELKEKNKELEKNTLKHIEENEKLKKEVDRTLKDKIDFYELECDFMKMKVLKEKFEKENKNLQDHLDFVKDSNKRLVREIAWYQSKIKKLEDLDNDY